MKTLKLKLDAAGESALSEQGLTLTDLTWLVVFGKRRETAEGTEISIDLGSIANRLGPRAAAQMLQLDGIVILVADGRIKECRRIAYGELNKEGKTDVSIE